MDRIDRSLMENIQYVHENFDLRISMLKQQQISNHEFVLFALPLFMRDMECDEDFIRKRLPEELKPGVQAELLKICTDENVHYGINKGFFLGGLTTIEIDRVVNSIRNSTKYFATYDDV